MEEGLGEARPPFESLSHIGEPKEGFIIGASSRDLSTCPFPFPFDREDCWEEWEWFELECWIE